MPLLTGRRLPAPRTSAAAAGAVAPLVCVPGEPVVLVPPVPVPTPSPSTPTTAPTPTPTPSGPAPDPVAVERAAVLHLVRRATFGPTPGLVDEVARTGRAAWVDAQLAPSRLDDAVVEAYVRRLPDALRTADDCWTGGIPKYSWNSMFDQGRATLARQAWSRRQLLEVVVDVMADHLHVASPSDDVWYCRADYDATVLRPHALGRFEDLLLAAAQHPAMLWYLDNARSSKGKVNENYGRELLELHTVGVEAGYTETEVKACARLMTGLTVDRRTGRGTYDPKQHDTGAVSVLGWSCPAHTAEEGRELQLSFLRHLASHPATARRVVTKLARRLVGDTPPAALVERVAGVYLARGTALGPVVRELLLAPDALAAATPKVKRPREDALSTVRALGVAPDPSGTKGVEALYWNIRGRGHAPADWAPPNGFPDVGAAWQSASATLASWDQHLELAHGWWPKGPVYPTADQLLPTPRPATYGALVDALALRLLSAPLPAAQRAAVVAFTGREASAALRTDKTGAVVDEWVGWRLGSLVCCVLDSPSFATR